MEIMNRDSYLYISRTSASETPWLFNIPVDILLLIFEHSDYFTLHFTFPLVCRAFRNLLRPELTPPNTAAVASPAIISAMNRIMFRGTHTSFLANSRQTISNFQIHPILSAIVFEARIPEGFHGFVNSTDKARLTPYQLDIDNLDIATWHRWAEAHPVFSKLSTETLKKSHFWGDNVISPSSKYLNISIDFNEWLPLFPDHLVEDEVRKLPDQKTKIKMDFNSRNDGISVSCFATRLIDFFKTYLKTGHFVFSVQQGWDFEDVLEISDNEMEEGSDEIVVTEVKIPRIDLKLQHWTIKELHDCTGRNILDGSGFQISLAM